MSSRSQETLMQKARQSHLLTERRAANHNAAEKDLNKWIFDTIQLRKGSYVLELCSGTGAQTTHLLDHVGPTGHVVALDISAQALQTLASTVKTSTPLTLIESDMDNLPQALHDHDLQDTYFDVVFCAYGLYYSSNARALLDECKKRIKPEGALIIVGPYGPNNHPFFELLTACQVEIPPFWYRCSNNSPS
ncbi:MAG: class I SAM-dependent methyltransferase [Bacteroidia bacterium]